LKDDGIKRGGYSLRVILRGVDTVLFFGTGGGRRVHQRGLARGSSKRGKGGLNYWVKDWVTLKSWPQLFF